jgi:hypothetical protein
MRPMILLLALSFLWAAAPVEASPRQLRGWETTLPGGRLKFEMKPTRRMACHGPVKGLGTMTLLVPKKRSKVQWSTHWFADKNKVFLHSKGVYLVRVGEGGNLKLDKRHDGLLFYKNGKLLYRYSTKDLIKDASKVRFRRALPKGCVSSYKFLKQVKGLQAYRFQVLTADNAELTFDIRTGKLLSRVKKR